MDRCVVHGDFVCGQIEATVADFDTVRTLAHMNHVVI
jgi:hypothetical protein